MKNKRVIAIAAAISACGSVLNVFLKYVDYKKIKNKDLYLSEKIAKINNQEIDNDINKRGF